MNKGKLRAVHQVSICLAEPDTFTAVEVWQGRSGKQSNGSSRYETFLSFIISLWRFTFLFRDQINSKRRGQEMASNIQRVSFINGPEQCFTTCNFWKSLVYLEWIGLHGLEELWWKYGMLDTLNKQIKVRLEEFPQKRSKIPELNIRGNHKTQ